MRSPYRDQKKSLVVFPRASFVKRFWYIVSGKLNRCRWRRRRVRSIIAYEKAWELWRLDNYKYNYIPAPPDNYFDNDRYWRFMALPIKEG